MDGGKLKIDIRRDRIREELEKGSKVLVTELSALLGATPVTIRSDLDALEREGVLERVTGGAVRKLRPITGWSVGGEEACAAEKQAIAAAVFGLIQDGDTVLLNSGTTTLYVATALRQRKNLHVVTNSLAAAMELGAGSTCRVLLLGGELNAQYGFVYGGDAQEQLRRYRADWSILSVDGVSAAGGVTTYHPEEAILDRMMLEQSRRRLIAADHTKLGRAGFTRVCPVGPEVCLVTTGGGAALAELRASGLRIESA